MLKSVATLVDGCRTVQEFPLVKFIIVLTTCDLWDLLGDILVKQVMALLLLLHA
jgi:hypothetical protein